MAKQRGCEDQRGRTGKAEVRLAGWGSSLLGEAANPSPREGSDETALWASAWEAFRPDTNPDEAAKLQLRDRISQIMVRNDRRHHPRVAQSAEISVRQLSSHLDTATGTLSADVQNFSSGGICIASPIPLVTSSVVQCQIGVPDLTVAIPTLMQVVWIEKLGASEYSAGLRYLV